MRGVVRGETEDARDLEVRACQTLSPNSTRRGSSSSSSSSSSPPQTQTDKQRQTSILVTLTRSGITKINLVSVLILN